MNPKKAMGNAILPFKKEKLEKLENVKVEGSSVAHGSTEAKGKDECPKEVIRSVKLVKILSGAM